MFLVNSRLGLFSAAIFRWHPFSLSYGVILPSSLTRVLPLVLGFSPRLPVSVCGTGAFSLASSFSRRRGFNNFPTCFSVPLTTQNFQRAYFTTRLPYRLDGGFHLPALSILPCHCFAQSLSAVQEYQPVVHRLRLLSSA